MFWEKQGLEGIRSMSDLLTKANNILSMKKTHGIRGGKDPLKKIKEGKE